MNGAVALVVALLSTPEQPPASMPASQPAVRVADTPIVWDDEREQLTRAYRAARYGQVGATSRIAPVGVVLHLTGEATFDASFALYRDARIDAARLPREAEVSPLGPSVHFLIDRDGTVHRLLDQNVMARHAGPLNPTATGVAFVGARQVDVTGEQLDAARGLLRQLDLDGRSLDFVVGHHEVESLRDSPVWLDPEGTAPTSARDPGARVTGRLKGVIPNVDVVDPGITFVYDRAWLARRSLRELILLRNGVYARYGRLFPTRPWVQKHFDAQPGYERNPDFDNADLAELDLANVRLIAEVERSFSVKELKARLSSAANELDERLAREALRKATQLKPLVEWRPGRSVPKKALAAAGRVEVLTLYARMTMELKLGGMSAGDCVFTEEETGLHGVCDAWEAHDEGEAGTDRKTLARVDRRTLARVERALARFVVDARYEAQDPLPHCYENCDMSWTERTPDGTDTEHTPTEAEVAACIGECDRDLRMTAREVAAERKQALAEVDRGIHAVGGTLVNEVLYGDMTGFG